MDSKREKLTKRDIAIISIIFMAIIGLTIASPFLPDAKPDRIKRELTKQGYDVTTTHFEYVGNGDRYHQWIYEASTPLFYDGSYISQWSISEKRYPWFISHTYFEVTPYLPLPEMVSINLTFTAEEVERIAGYAAGQPIDDYLKQIALRTLDEYALSPS